MTDAELVREIAQPLTNQSGDYDALNQSGASTRTHSQAGAKRKRIRHEFCTKCFGSAMRPRIALAGQ
jgi:hypothetical protein